MILTTTIDNNQELIFMNMLRRLSLHENQTFQEKCNWNFSKEIKLYNHQNDFFLCFFRKISQNKDQFSCFSLLAIVFLSWNWREKSRFSLSLNDLQIFFQLETFHLQSEFSSRASKTWNIRKKLDQREFSSHKKKILINWKSWAIEENQRVRRKKSGEVNSFCDEKLISSQAIVKQSSEKSLWLHNFFFW